ncbi:MAG: hypothetical protein JNK46_09470 [Methylobacteriaceae bacterium]|nr:hypothetical protein [Methylobacteriaceae bacterium]
MVMAQRLSKKPDPDPIVVERGEVLLSSLESIGREAAALALANTNECIINCVRALARLPIDPGSIAARRAAIQIFSREC